jgi:hydrogenase maturation protease
MNVMVAGVGYTNLRDLSVGPVLVPRLREMDWPEGVEVDDLSFGPIAVVLRMRDRPGYYHRMVLVSAVERGRPPGGPYCYRWTGELPDPEEIQARVGEAVTGVISVDNLLIVAEHFGALPRDVIVVEVEPEDTGWGPGFTPTIEGTLDPTIDLVRQVTLNGYDG